MFLTSLKRLFALPYAQVVDGATGGGSSQGSQGSQGSNSGSQGQQGQGAQGQQGGNAPAHVTLTADSMFVPPGGTTPVKFSDWQRGYVPVSEHNTQKSAAVAAALKALVAANRGKQQRTQPQGQPQQPADFFGDVRGLPVVDGQSLAQLGERIQREGIGPLYEWAGKVNQFLERANERLQGTERFAGSYNESQQSAEFKGKIGNTLKSVASELFPGVNIAEHPVLSDIAEDVYLSYQPNDPNLEREYPTMLKQRFEGLMKVASALQTAKLNAARETRRNFLRPGGAGQPSGQGGNPRLSHRDIARNAFAGDASRT